MIKISVLDKVLEIKGIEHQSVVAIEEMSELTKELVKMKRGKGDLQHVAEEIADVEIMLAQLKVYYNIQDEVSKFWRIKLNRLEKRLAEECI